MTSAVRTLQRWLRPLERTPLHPQWLVLRHRADTGAWVRAHAVGRLLDVGCGNGRLRSELGGRVDYVGIDYPATVALGYTGTADILADAASLPVASGSADVVALLDVLEHLPSPERALGEAARVLRAGGKCLVHVPFLYPLHDEPHDFQRWTRHGLERLLASQGFDVLELHETIGGVEAGAALLAIALTKGALDSARRRTPALLIAVAALPLVPLINVVAWLLGTMLPRDGIMPFSYRVVAARRADAGGPCAADEPQACREAHG